MEIPPVFAPTVNTGVIYFRKGLEKSGSVFYNEAKGPPLRSAEGERDMNFWPDFIKLKTSVGGNREQHGYEETFGQPREEQQHITVPAKHIRRILSQLEFAIRLTAEREGEFD